MRIAVLTQRELGLRQHRARGRVSAGLRRGIYRAMCGYAVDVHGLPQAEQLVVLDEIQLRPELFPSCEFSSTSSRTGGF